MAVNKSQDELEQPAKVYQLDAVESKVDQAIIKLDTLIAQTSSVVTHAQLAAELKEAKKEIHLTYGPMKENLKWFTRAVILEGLAILAQVIIIFIIARE